MTDRLGRLLLVTLEAARVNADLPVLGAAEQLVLARVPAAQDGFHIRRQIIEELSRKHDGPGGQSSLAPVALARKGAPGLEVKILGEMDRQQPDGLLQGRCRNGQLDRRPFIHRGQRLASMSHRRLTRNCLPPIARADG